MAPEVVQRTETGQLARLDPPSAGPAPGVPRLDNRPHHGYAGESMPVPRYASAARVPLRRSSATLVGAHWKRCCRRCSQGGAGRWR